MRWDLSCSGLLRSTLGPFRWSFVTLQLSPTVCESFAVCVLCCHQQIEQGSGSSNGEDHGCYVQVGHSIIKPRTQRVHLVATGPSRKRILVEQ
jgi:hypothetical protein